MSYNEDLSRCIQYVNEYSIEYNNDMLLVHKALNRLLNSKYCRFSNNFIIMLWDTFNEMYPS